MAEKCGLELTGGEKNSDYMSRLEHRESNARTYSRKFPFSLKRAKGCRIEDVEGNQYLDFLCGAGSLALGHNDPEVNAAMIDMLTSEAPLHTLDLMNRCAAGHCFLVKPTRRSDEIMDGAFGEVGLPRKADELDMTVLNTFNYLWLKGITPEVTSKKEIWTLERSVEKMTAWCIDQASLRKELTSEEKERVHGFVEKRSVGGTVTEKVETTVVTVYWEVQ